jgi:hypothetical protein
MSIAKVPMKEAVVAVLRSADGRNRRIEGAGQGGLGRRLIDILHKMRSWLCPE